MPKISELHPVVRGWLFDGPLAEHVPAYLARLSDGRYAAHTVARSLAAIAHFAHWMALSRLLVVLEDAVVMCRARGPCFDAVRGRAAGLSLHAAHKRALCLMAGSGPPSGSPTADLRRRGHRP